LKYLKNHKERIPLAAVIIVILYAAFNLFSNQPESSRFTQSGATILSSQTTGGAGRCNIPSYEEYYGQRPVARKSKKNTE